MPAVRSLIAALLTLAAAFCPLSASAQMADRCLAVAQAPRLVHPAAFRPAALKPTEVRLTFIGHSTWLIESPGAVKIATDYNDYIRPSVVPDIATMNRAHTTHYSNFPDPDIKHVLRGWNPEGGPAKHDMTVADSRVRNVPTNIRDWGGGAISHGNSIFIFEIASMCIGHLGHLHHTLTDQQIAQIGQLDVVMVPVDGSYTMDVAGIVEVLKALRARLILPMHYFNPYTLNRFLDRIRNDFPVETATEPMLVDLAEDAAERAQGAGAAGELTQPERASRSKGRQLQHLAAGAGGQHALEVGQAGIEGRLAGAAVERMRPGRGPRRDPRRRSGCRRIWASRVRCACLLPTSKVATTVAVSDAEVTTTVGGPEMAGCLNRLRGVVEGRAGQPAELEQVGRGDGGERQQRVADRLGGRRRHVEPSRIAEHGIDQHRNAAASPP